MRLETRIIRGSDRLQYCKAADRVSCLSRDPTESQWKKESNISDCRGATAGGVGLRQSCPMLVEGISLCHMEDLKLKGH